MKTERAGVYTEGGLVWLIGADLELNGGRRGKERAVGCPGLGGLCLGWRVMPALGGGGECPHHLLAQGVAPCSSQCHWRGISEEACDVNGVTELGALPKGPGVTQRSNNLLAVLLS